MKDEKIIDIICQVLYNGKSQEIIHKILNEFIPEYEEIHKNFGKPSDLNYEFKSETELIQYYGEVPNIAQTLYWNKYKNNPDKIMVGVNVTNDNKIVFSLTLNGSHRTKEKFYKKLKKQLDSDVGVISYVNPVFYESGNDFMNKFKDNKYDFEEENSL